LDENGKPEEPETTEEVCDKCKKPMAVKHGRYGSFLGCTGYPDCKNIKQVVKTTGAKCTQCNKGGIVEKRSKKGKTFYACDQYPECDYALWSKPTGEPCPQCKNLLVYGAKDTKRCSNKDCGYQK